MRRLFAITFAFPLLTAPLGPQSAASHPPKNVRSSAPADSDLTADQQVLHALNRLTFGPRPGDVEAVRQLGLSAWIERQLHPERIDDARAEQIIASLDMVNADQNELANEYAVYVRDRAMLKQARSDTNATAEDSMALRKLLQSRTRLVGELGAARITRAEFSERQLLEVVTDFWENHFNISARKNAATPYYLVEYDRMIRAHALGKFRDLLGAVARSPAMLTYLDNAQSRANPGQPTLEQERRNARRLPPRLQQLQQQVQQRVAGLNENYGRELLELHTLGVDGGYTQTDVVNAARALTGWTIRPPGQGGGFIFRPQWHDAAEKVILGHRMPAGRGEQDGEELLDIVARHPSTARYIAFKLARRFVSDTPPASLVTRAAQTFTRTDGDIREVLRTIITSPEFFSSAAYRAKVKTPFEVVVSAARALDAQPDTTPRGALVVAYLGQPIFGHQDPNGWPETGEAWMNTGAILGRINFGMAVGANRLPGVAIGRVSWAQPLRTAPRDQQVDAVITHLLGGNVSSITRNILVSGEHPMAAQAARAADSVVRIDRNADTGNNMMTPDASGGEMAMAGGGRARRVQNMAAPNARGNDGPVRRVLGPPPQLTGLAQVIGLAVGSPEFQRK